MRKTDKNISLIEEKIEKFIISEYSPGLRLPSERKIARLLNTTQNRVHRAINRLTERKILFTRRGDGTYLNGDGHSPALNQPTIPVSQYQHVHTVPVYKKLTISYPIFSDPYSAECLKQSIAQVSDEIPFIDTDIQNGPEKSDLLFQSQVALSATPNDYAEIDTQLLRKFGFDIKEMPQGLPETGMFKDRLVGLPFCRQPSLIWINPAIFENYDINPEDIKEPLDLIRSAAEIEKKSRNLVRGFFYRGVLYHTAQQGLSFRRGKDGRLVFDKERLASYLEQSKPFMRDKSMQKLYSYFRDISLFWEGKCAILPEYMNFMPFLKDNMQSPFQAQPIKLPLTENGFPYECNVLISIKKDSKLIEEAHIILAGLMKKNIQSSFCRKGYFASVRKDIIEEQKKNSPFPDGSISYDFHPEAYNRSLEKNFYHIVHPGLNTEAGKFYCGFQSMEETMDRMEAL